MQVKSATSYNFSSIRLANIQKSDNILYQQGCRKQLMGMQSGTTVRQRNLIMSRGKNVQAICIAIWLLGIYSKIFWLKVQNDLYKIYFSNGKMQDFPRCNTQYFPICKMQSSIHSMIPLVRKVYTWMCFICKKKN